MFNKVERHIKKFISLNIVKFIISIIFIIFSITFFAISLKEGIDKITFIIIFFTGMLILDFVSELSYAYLEFLKIDINYTNNANYSKNEYCNIFAVDYNNAIKLVKNELPKMHYNFIAMVNNISLIAISLFFGFVISFSILNNTYMYNIITVIFVLSLIIFDFYITNNILNRYKDILNFIDCEEKIN